MTYDEARQVLTAHILPDFLLAYPGIPVETDNRVTIDREEQLTIGMYAELLIGFGDEIQASLGPAGLRRQIGDVAFIINVPEGEGSSAALQLLEWVRAKISRVQLGPLITQPARKEYLGLIEGFEAHSVSARFHYDSI